MTSLAPIYSPEALGVPADRAGRKAHRATLKALLSGPGQSVGTRLLKTLPWRLQHLDSVIVLRLERKPVRPSLIKLRRPNASGNASR